ncbi:cache domain-containing protein [Streptomyces sp. NPDC127068]|uniref:cache domain-containing protein n=1 Tax=Streptomyces sp. NPDC127068 TaxID=3347127 RepID=UPI00365DC82E
MGAPRRRGGPLLPDLDPDSDHYYDYTGLRWFTVPRDQRRPTVCGPYVDLHGSDSYVFTFALPLTVAGEFFGVVAGDVLVSTLARLLVPPLLQLGGEAAVTNEEGRVIATTTPSLAVGALAATPPAGGRRSGLRVAGAEWNVLHLRPSPHAG